MELKEEPEESFEEQDEQDEDQEEDGEQVGQAGLAVRAQCQQHKKPARGTMATAAAHSCSSTRLDAQHPMESLPEHVQPRCC
jgi:hypothetical protein